MPRCAELTCGRWRPERLVPRWATGLRFNGRWYCSRPCVELAVRARLDAPAAAGAVAPSLPPLRLGVLLRHLGVLTEADLERALAGQKVSGLRLGAELRRQGLVGPEPVLRALAAQSGVSYLASFDARRAAHGPSWLPEAMVRALGLIPFELDPVARTVRVICTAPVPRAAMRALTKLTGWLPEPYLVDDSVWEEALLQYHAGPEGTPAVSSTVDTLATAAARVADLAQQDRAVTMRHATYDHYTWVRIEGTQQLADFIVAGTQEEPCLAAHTAH